MVTVSTSKSNTFCYFSSKDPLILSELHLFCHLLQPPPNPIEVHKEDINFHLQLHLEQNNNKQVLPHMLHLPRVAVMLIDMLFLTVLWQLLLPMGSDLLPILVMHNQLKVNFLINQFSSTPTPWLTWIYFTKILLAHKLKRFPFFIYTYYDVSSKLKYAVRLTLTWLTQNLANIIFSQNQK